MQVDTRGRGVGVTEDEQARLSRGTFVRSAAAGLTAIALGRGDRALAARMPFERRRAALKTLRIINGIEPATLDIDKTVGETDISIANNIDDSLIRSLNSSFKTPGPRLAVSWKNVSP